MNYYNEINPYAVKWLRNLIAAGHLPQGDVDERSIEDVQPKDLEGYGQCHFFAGIGGWPLALRLAGWPEDEPVWTGSCPCQPLSGIGKHRGHADQLHLWPAFYHLIAKSNPSVVFGEQVASKDGCEWFAGVRADLEATGYACGCANLCAAGAGAPHIRQRLFWVAHRQSSRDNIKQAKPKMATRDDANGFSGRRRKLESSAFCNYNSIKCGDGKERRIEPGLSPLAHGVPNRVGRLRAYGNAIVPQVAAEFVCAFME